MKHLKHSDHGALRYTVGSASVESEPPAAAAAVADGEVSGAVWEQVFSFVGDKSLSSVPLNPLTATEKALAGLCAARSRLFQVRKHGTLDFFGSDVAGVAIGGWETKLGELVSEAEQRLQDVKDNARKEAGPEPSATAVENGDEGAVPMEVDGGEAVPRVSEEEEEEEEEEGDDDDDDDDEKGGAAVWGESDSESAGSDGEQE